MSKLSIIRWNDDNHAERVWINGKCIGDMSDPDRIFSKIIEATKKYNPDEYEGTTVYLCEDFDEYAELFANEEEFEEWVDEMSDWFYDVEEMSPKQVELIEQFKLDRLYKETMGAL